MDNFDIFSSPFLLQVRRDDVKKRTHLGGLITLSVFGISVAYFVVILMNFFQRVTPPSISTYQFVNQGKTQPTFEYFD